MWIDENHLRRTLRVSECHVQLMHENCFSVSCLAWDHHFSCHPRGGRGCVTLPLSRGRCYMFTQSVVGDRGVVGSIVFGDESTEEELVELFKLSGGESVILPLLKDHESGDDLEVAVVVPRLRRRTLYASFWFCVPLRVNGGMGRYQYSDCTWEEVAGASGAFVESRCAPRGM
jgi:hypothetical protein